jgi:two-component system, chemotaxis family, response regulator Rcp1
MDVLLIEDNAADVRSAEEAFGSSPQPLKLHVVSDGVEAMSFLRKEGAYWGAPRPHLILLNLRVPKTNGRQVLTDIENDGALSAIPMIILTVAASPEDIQYCYETRVISYAIKPRYADAFNHLAQVVNSFLASLAKFPSVAGKSRTLIFGGPEVR